MDEYNIFIFKAKNKEHAEKLFNYEFEGRLIIRRIEIKNDDMNIDIEKLYVDAVANDISPNVFSQSVINLFSVSNHVIPSEIFYNKELSDVIRDIVMNSACDFHQAIRFMNKSKNHKRDAELIKKLKNCGISEKQVNVFISAINS